MNIVYGIIIGIVVEKIVFPIIDIIRELVVLSIEEKKNRIVYEINSLNKQDDIKEENKKVIGFKIGDE